MKKTEFKRESNKGNNEFFLNKYKVKNFFMGKQSNSFGKYSVEE